MGNFPQHNRKNEQGPPVIPIGDYDVSLVIAKHQVAKASGADMMVSKMIVDNGQHQGGSCTDLFVFGHESLFGEKKLQSMCNRARTTDSELDPAVDLATGLILYNGANGQPTTDPKLATQDDDGDAVMVKPGGFVFTSDVDSWEAYCNQFNHTPVLRFRISAWHEYDIEVSDGNWERKVSKDKFDAFVQKGGRGSTKVKIRYLAPPAAPPTLELTAEGTETGFPQATNGVTYPGTNAAPAAEPAAVPEGGAPF